MLMRSWTPPPQVAGTPVDNNIVVQNQRTRIRCCKVVISGFIPIILFGFCIVYTLQKQTIFNEEYHYKQQDNYEKDQYLIFNTYINDITNILLQTIDDNNLLYIQTKTKILFKNLDQKYKKDIFIFLYERNLLQNKKFYLKNLNFDNIELICSQNFHHIYLSKIHWSNGIFINCHLISINFNQSYFYNIKFINSTLENISFIQTNLDYSQFIQTSILNSDFSSASLIQANFLQADTVQGNNFTNADLYQAQLTKDQFDGKKITIIQHDFTNARYPNGSFELISSNKNLVCNGDAEINDSIDNQTIWKIIDRRMNLSIETNENISINNNHWGNYSFVIVSKTRVYQTINLYSYSLLIDTNNAALSFSAYANCNQSYFEIHMYRSDGILNGLQIYLKPIEENNHKLIQQYGEDQYHIPIRTQYIEIYFGIDIFQTNMKCYFDNITLTIHQSLKN